MNGYAPKFDQKLGSLQPLSGAQANTVISKNFPITAEGSKNFIARIKVSGVTVALGITAKLQTSMDSANWVDSKTGAVAADGYVYIKIQQALAGDQTYTPLLCVGRLVITLQAGDSATVDSVEVLQEE